MYGFIINCLQKEGSSQIAQKQTSSHLLITDSLQKGFAHFILLFILLAGIGVGLYLVQNPQILGPYASENRYCSANSVTSFRDCLGKVSANQADIVEVQNMITCQKADGCEFNIDGVHRPVVIKGKKGIRAGIKRLDWFQNPVLRITNSEKIYVTDLVFDENDRVKCAPYQNFSNSGDPDNKNGCFPQYCSAEKTACDPTIVVGSSNNTVFDNVEILYSKWIGLALYDGKDHRILNSLFKATEDLDPTIGGRPNGSGWYGFWTWNNTKQYEFINNRLINHQSNTGIFISNATAEKHTLVKGNFFQNNGSIDLVNSGGGTLGILPHFYYGEVIYNEIIEGKGVYNKKGNYYSPNGGIEMDVLSSHQLPPGVNANDQMHYTNIRGNVIHNIEGIYGIGIGDRGFYSNVNIADNVVYDIRALYSNWIIKPIDIQAGNAISYNNCINNPNCPIPAYSTLTATPDVCFRGSDGNCASTVRWSSKSLGNIVLKDHKTGNSIPSAQGAAGSVEFSWTNTPGEGVDLYSNGKVIESLILRDGKLHEELNISSKGSIAAEPKECNLSGKSTCSTKISWDLSNYPNQNANTEIRIRESGALFGAGGIRGSADAPWITAEGYHFDIYADGLPYDSVFVKAAGQPSSPSPTASPTPTPVSTLITASPNPCTIVSGNTTCTSAIKLNASGYTNLQIKVREASNAPFTGVGANPTGVYNAPWIPASGYTFDLYSNGTVIGSVFVKGIAGIATPTPTPTPASTLITASPNPCTIVSGNTTCTSAIKLNASGYTNLQIKVREASNAPFTGVGANPTGVYNAPWIPASGYTFDLYSNGTVIGSVFVKGN